MNCNDVRIFNSGVLTEEVTCRRIRREDGHGCLVVRNWKKGARLVCLEVSLPTGMNLGEGKIPGQSSR